MRKLVVLLFIHIVFISSFAFAQTISVEAKVDSSQYLIGDLIHSSITAEYSPNIKLLKPAVKDSLKNLAILSIDEPTVSEKNGKKLSRFNFTLSKYDSGTVKIPPINLFYLVGNDTSDSKLLNLPQSEMLNNPKVRVIQTDPVNFRVNLVQVNLKKDIKDVKEPVKIPYSWEELLIYILIALLIIGILYYIYHRYKKKKSGAVEEKKIIKLPPHIEALNELRKLREEGLWQQGLIKEYHSRITEIIRTYFSERFNLPALEMTTAETLSSLRKNKETGIILETTKNFLTNADLVKFAKYIPLKSLNEEMMQQAEEIINRTIKAETVNSQEVEHVQ